MKLLKYTEKGTTGEIAWEGSTVSGVSGVASLSSSSDVSISMPSSLVSGDTVNLDNGVSSISGSIIDVCALGGGVEDAHIRLSSSDISTLGDEFDVKIGVKVGEVAKVQGIYAFSSTSSSSSPSSKQFWYTSTTGEILESTELGAFDNEVVSNVYSGGKGIVTFANPITEVPNFAFQGWSSYLTSITLPDGITEIGYCSFEDCENLTEITLPGSLTTTSYNSFLGCTGIETIVVRGNLACSLDFTACISLSSSCIQTIIDSWVSGASIVFSSMWKSDNSSSLNLGIKAHWNEETLEYGPSSNIDDPGEIDYPSLDDLID